MASSFESSDSFDTAVDGLVDKLHPPKAGVRSVFKSPFADSEVNGDMLKSTNRLKFWKSVRQLLICIHKCSNPDDEVVKKWEFGTLIKIEAVFNDIAGNLLIWKRPREFLDFLGVSEERISNLFKLEIGEALNCLSNSPLQWRRNHSLPASISLCQELFEFIQQILGCIRQETDGDLSVQSSDILLVVLQLQEFLKQAPKDIDVWSVRRPNDDMINNFLSHLLFVAVRTANQFVRYWIHRKKDPDLEIVGLLELQREIDPSCPQFLELIFKFLTALRKISHRNSMPYCCWCIFDSYWSQKNDCTEMLETLIFFVISEPEETASWSLVSEVKLLLQQRLLRPNPRLGRQAHSSVDLCRRICLLNAEVLLKQQPNPSSTVSMRNQVKQLKKLVTFLGRLSDQPPKNKAADVRQTLTFLHEVAGKVASLFQSFNEQKITECIVRISLFKLLLKVVLFKAEFSCTELLKFLDGNESMMGSVKDGIETIVEGLNLFKAFVTSQQGEAISKDAELIFPHIEDSARRVIALSYSLETSEITNEVIVKLNLSVSNLVDKMKVIKAELRQLCAKFPSSTFPKINGLGFIDFLLENLMELLKNIPDSDALMKHHIERIQLDLQALRSLVMMPNPQDPELEILGRRVTDVAYEAEYIIGSIEVENGDNWQHLLRLDDLVRKIRYINTQAASICKEKSCNKEGSNAAQISSQMISRVSRPQMGGLVVCISEDEEIVINRLTRGSHQRDLIAIVGVPGIGKTTLANKVYNNPKVTFYFHVLSWFSVSQAYSKRELLLGILSDIASGLAEKGDINEMTDDDLEQRLYRCLKQKRYLIILDDVWDTEAWNCLERSFPDDGNGSRVLMTSRLHNVALRAKPDSSPHELHLFSDDESWKLLQLKVFRGDCPKELLEVGKDIAKSCKGLPLAIVAIAGILEKTEGKHDAWRKIAESLTTQIIDNPQTKCREILELSYNHLPDYLKACFLYFGALLVDKDIPVCKLIRLWIAEGFIQKTMLKSLEDVAEDYLEDLIGRSLITPSNRGSNGKVKACRMHDLLRDLCLSKAKDENFLQVITSCDEPYVSFPNVDYIDYHPPDPVNYENHRVCIHLNRKHFVKSHPSGSCTRSLIFFPTSDRNPRRPYDISFVPDSFKLLTVLDLENINMGTSFPTGIESLVLLRYLAVCGDIDLIPPAISKLQKLETFVVNGLKGEVVLPDSIWGMERLRHLHVNNHVVFNFQDDQLACSWQLANLLSFSSPVLSHGKVAKKILRRLPNLRKLRCIYLESWDAVTNYNKFPVLDFLIHLESLKIFYIGGVLKYPGELCLPWSLKKLTLSNFRLPWIHIGAIGRLKNLEVLKLLSKAFEGLIWDMRNGEFLELKYLKLDGLNISQWNASADHLPNLQQLVLRNCMELVEVPAALGEISTLQIIEVQSCSLSTEESVRYIGEQDIEGLKITINHRVTGESIY